jgi:hypothetical protein
MSRTLFVVLFYFFPVFNLRTLEQSTPCYANDPFAHTKDMQRHVYLQEKGLPLCYF